MQHRSYSKRCPYCVPAGQLFGGVNEGVPSTIPTAPLGARKRQCCCHGQCWCQQMLAVLERVWAHRCPGLWGDTGGVSSVSCQSAVTAAGHISGLCLGSLSAGAAGGGQLPGQPLLWPWVQLFGAVEVQAEGKHWSLGSQLARLCSLACWCHHLRPAPKRHSPQQAPRQNQKTQDWCRRVQSRVGLEDLLQGGGVSTRAPSFPSPACGARVHVAFPTFIPFCSAEHLCFLHFFWSEMYLFYLLACW